MSLLIPPLPEADAAPIILIVDDDRIIRRLLRQVMEQEGYRVIEGNNGQECLDLYRKHDPDLVLIDAMMPVMDGFTCCRRLRDLEQTYIENQEDVDTNRSGEDPLIRRTKQILASVTRTPVLMITALNDADSVNQAFQSGAIDYITKPIPWAVLRQRVKHLVEQSKLYHQLEIANSHLQRLATVDGLTQLANRRRFDEYLRQEWRLMLRRQEPLSLILCDIDCFKSYNDTLGHQEGDRCLQRVAAVMACEARRPSDLAARYGGEELVVLLPETDHHGAYKVAQEVRNHLHALKIPHPGSPVAPYVTASFGLATCVPQVENTPETLIQSADEALYLAKAQGRDRICSHALMVKIEETSGLLSSLEANPVTNPVPPAKLG